MRPAVRGRWLAAAVVAALCVSSFASRSKEGDPAPRDPSVSLMNDVSQQFRHLEARLAAGDGDGFAAAASDLAALRDRLGSLTPEVNESLVDEFDAQVVRFGELVDEARDWASQGRLGAAGQTLEELRATCVSCHLKFRSNNVERGHYPAQRNTITGTVDLRDADGVERVDRSWVLVFLESSAASGYEVGLRRNPRISQSERRFHPRVLPVIAGTTVDFPNDDTIFHNVFSLSKTAPFDLGVYEPGESSSVRMERTGLVKVYCNIHPEMAASIVVLANPWYALTDRAGRFVVCGVPDGEYVLRAWNDMGAESREPIAVAGNVVLETHIDLAETRRAVSHTNKFGKPYTGKYK